MTRPVTDGLLMLALLAAGIVGVWYARIGGAPLRSGPWPGLTPRGASALLAVGCLLGAGQLWLGAPSRALPDLISQALVLLIPLLIATRVVRTPGAASAACGVYLLPRSLIALIDPTLEPPPLLLVPAFVLDVAFWLRPGDVRVGRQRRRPDRRPRRIGTRRAAAAGAIFGASVAAVFPAFAVLLRGDASGWQTSDVLTAAAITMAACAALGLSVRGTESPPPAAPTR